MTLSIIAKFSDELARRVIKLYSGRDGIVLYPFLGSGTTAVAALREGRRYIGIEKEERYVLLARNNIKKAQMQTSLFDETPQVRTVYPCSAIGQSAAELQN